MNKVEYIPGDLVTTNGVPIGTTEGVVYRVKAIHFDREVKLKNGTVLKGKIILENTEKTKSSDKSCPFYKWGAWVKDIVPLELSSEILEKNGWKPNDMMPYPTYFKGKTSEYVLTFDGYFWRFKYDGRFLPVEIKYIHQLQHLLFGLGLNSKMEV